MKFADRLKVASSGTSAAVLTLGAAAAKCRTLSQVIGNKDMSVGETNVPFWVEDNTGNWEAGLYTITSTTVITRTTILNSSSGGAAVTFDGGTLTVFNSAPAALLNSVMPNSDDVGFDVVLCAGQSNMVGQDGTTSGVDNSDPRVFTFGGYPSESTTYQKILQATDPLRHYGQVSYGVGPAMAFAKAYALTLPTNRKILLVPVAQSSTYLYRSPAEWSPGDINTGNVLYENAISQANLALTAAKAIYPNSRFAGTYWLQGENDANWSVSQADYESALKTLILGFRTRITGATDSFFVIAGMIGEYATNSIGTATGFPAIDAAHRKVAKEFPHCAYTAGLSGFPLSAGNTIHYSAMGARLMGWAGGVAVASAIASKGVDTTAPTILAASVADNDRSTIMLRLSEPFDPNYPPIASAYTVAGHPITSTTGSRGNLIKLTTSNPFVNGEAARTVTFTAPGTSGVRDLAGNLMATQSPVSITNNVLASDTTPPTLSGATVANASPSTLTMTASESLDTTYTPAASAFTVSGHTVTSVAVASGTVTLSLGEAFVNGEAARTVMYTQPASNGVRDLVGNLMATFLSALSVTNNVASSDTTAPTFASAQVANASPTVVQITMSESLAASVPPTSAFSITENGSAKTVSSVAVNGAVVSVTCSAAFMNGTTIQATYTAPGADPRIKDASGNVTANFGPVTVTNNVAAAGGADLQFSNFTSMTDTSVGGPGVAPYTYKMSGVNFGGAPQGGSSVKSLTGDGSVTTKINISPSGRHMFALKTSSGTTNYAALPYVFWAETGGYTARGTGWTSVTSGKVPANGDYMRLTRTGNVLKAEVSSDNQQTWVTIWTWSGISTAALWCQILGEGAAEFVNPVYTGNWA